MNEFFGGTHSMAELFFDLADQTSPVLTSALFLELRRRLSPETERATARVLSGHPRFGEPAAEGAP